MIWQKHLSGGLEHKRLPAHAINVTAAVAEPRISHLTRVAPRENVIALITLQIKDLIDFFNFKSTMSSEQIVDTAEFVVDEHYNLSLMAVQDCFNLIKKAKPPFDKDLYQSIDGRKILEALNKYDIYMHEHLMAAAEEESKTSIRSAMDNPREFKKFKEFLTNKGK